MLFKAAFAGAWTYQSSSYLESLIRRSTGTRSGANCAHRKQIDAAVDRMEKFGCLAILVNVSRFIRSGASSAHSSIVCRDGQNISSSSGRSWYCKSVSNVVFLPVASVSTRISKAAAVAFFHSPRRILRMSLSTLGSLLTIDLCDWRFVFVARLMLTKREKPSSSQTWWAWGESNSRHTV